MNLLFNVKIKSANQLWLGIKRGFLLSRALKSPFGISERVQERNFVPVLSFSSGAVDFHSGGRFSRARLQPPPSLRSVRVLPLVLFPQKSPPPFPST